MCIVSGCPPFIEDRKKKMTLNDQILNANYKFRKEYFENVSDQAKDLIKKLLVVDPEKRFSSDEILQHPWLQVILNG